MEIRITLYETSGYLAMYTENVTVKKCLPGLIEFTTEKKRIVFSGTYHVERDLPILCDMCKDELVHDDIIHGFVCRNERCSKYVKEEELIE